MEKKMNEGMLNNYTILVYSYMVNNTKEICYDK